MTTGGSDVEASGNFPKADDVGLVWQPGHGNHEGQRLGSLFF